MNARAHRSSPEPNPQDPRAPAPLADPLEPSPSPARSLQEALARRLGETPPPEVQRWPGAVRVAVIVGASAGLWAALISAVRLALA